MSEQPTIVKKATEKNTVVIFTKNSMELDKTILVVNLPPLSFLDGPTNQRIKVSMQGDWDR